jgi:hypothetical protein
MFKGNAEAAIITSINTVKESVKDEALDAQLDEA